MKNLDDLMLDLLETIEETSDINLMRDSRLTNKPKTNLPGWKKDIDPLIDMVHFWSVVWKSAGKPVNSQLQDIMKKTRN